MPSMRFSIVIHLNNDYGAEVPNFPGCLPGLGYQSF